MRSALLVGLCLTGALPLAAQERHGFWLNGGFGYATAGCSGCDGRTDGVGGEFSLGGTLGPKWQLGAGSSGWYHSYDGGSTALSTIDARVRFYPSRTGNFFLTGGIGLGLNVVKVNGVNTHDETGGGAVLGLGYDIRVGKSLSLTPYWNSFGISTDNNDFNVGQIGMSLTYHKFRGPGTTKQEAAPVAAPEPSAAPPSIELAPDMPFVGDTRLKLYYPAACAANKAIPSEFQVRFQSEDGAQRDGFQRSGDC
jgi:Outer membrane protein beta-barrel domain